jgi:uncharacterized protein YjdB
MASMLLAVVLIAAGIIPMFPAKSANAEESGFIAAGTIYYVDSMEGDDENAGTSPASAWKTLDKLNATTFQPGDAILFEAGGTWTGKLHPKGSGSDGLPIQIDKYGEGPKPLLAGDGADAAIYFYNQEYWEIRNLEITNHAEAAGQRRGIHVSGNSGDDWNNLREYRHFVMENLTIHSVKGEQGGGWFSGGIIVWSPTYNFAVSDVTVRNNKIYSLDSVGVYLNGASRLFSSGNRIQNNMIYDISADGAVLLNTTNGLIENNVVFDTHKRAGGYHIPLWTWGTENAVIQYNEVFNTYPGGDAMAYDSDYRSTGTKIQYNYSHNNAGGFVLVINDGTNQTNINRNTVIRYNISQNDHHTIFTLGGPVENTLIHNNTIYIPEHANVRVVGSGNWGGYAKDTYFYNNIIMNLGTGSYVFNQSINNVFDSNLFYGNHPAEVLAMDANKITADPMLASPGSAKIGRDTVSGYQLLHGSPAIGAGRIIPGHGGLDFWGNPVPADSRPNIGAYEGTGLDPDHLPPLLPPPGQVNLFVNPGFEAGDFTGWGNHYGEAAIVGSNVRTGQYAARLANAGSGMEQTLSGLKPNTMYRLSGYAQATDGGSAALGVKNYGTGFKDVQMSSASYSWKEVAFQTGSSNTSATFYLYKSSGTGVVYLDDLQLIEYGEVPPPAEAPKPPQGPQPGKQNLAPTARLSVSSTNGDFTADKVVDGVKLSFASRWITASGQPGPHWLQMEWDQAYDIERIRMWSGQDGSAGRQAADFQVQYWNGTEWSPVVSITGNTMDGFTGQFNDIEFPAITTDKMRIWITKGSIYDDVARVFEIEVWEKFDNNGEIVPISSITVASQSGANTIKEAGAAMQMVAAVLPYNATNKSVTWSVVREDGEATDAATISATGIVTAIKAGTVKVVAAAAEGSGVIGESLLYIDFTKNLAPTAALSASSSHENGTSPPRHLVDGIKNQDAKRWITNTTLAGPHWFQMDWGKDYSIHNVKVWSGFMSLYGRQIADFQVQYWDEGEWQTAETVTGNTYDGRLSQFNDLKFPAVTTDKMRLYITKGSAYDNVARVFEVEVWGQESLHQTIPVSALTVAGENGASTIDGIGRTLQMTATVLPANATDKSVTWAVYGENGEETHAASIDGNGLVTALAEGIVKVAAVANDGSGARAESVVTIEAGPPVTGTDSVQLSGPAAVSAGQMFDLTYSLVNVTSSVYAQGSMVHYNPELLEYVGVSPILDNFTVSGSTYGDDIIQVVGFRSHVPVTGSADLFTLRFRALDTQQTVTGSVYLTYVTVGDHNGNESTLNIGPAYQVQIAVPEVDKTALATAISAAESLSEISYIPSTWSRLQAALAEAVNVKDHASATQAEVNVAASNLLTAINSLQLLADVTALNTKIAEAEAAANAAKISERLYGHYKQAAADALKTDIDAAKWVAVDAEAAQEAVDLAVVTLQRALQTFQTSINSKMRIGDLSFMAAHYGEKSANNSSWSEISMYDFNGNMELDLFDLAHLAKRITLMP